jgi:hypothetical protein
LNINRTTLAAIGLVGLLASAASAQGIAFQPVIGSFPNGVTMSVTPSVSYDRRYVRLGINPQFTQLNGFDTYSVPGAITGGRAGGGGLVGFAGMNGPIDGFETAIPSSFPGDPPLNVNASGGGFAGSDMLQWQPINPTTGPRAGAAPKAAQRRRKPVGKAGHPAASSPPAVRKPGKP